MRVQATRHGLAEKTRPMGRRGSALPEGFPRGGHPSKGAVRWYLVHVPEGAERSTADRVKKLVPTSLLQDAFVISKECWVKRGGTWSTQVKQLYPEYFLVATGDVAALDKALTKLSFHVRVAGSRERAYQPMAAGAQAWLESSMDADHVVRGSIAEIIDGELHVLAGPLVGQEPRVVRYDRRKRYALVDVGHEEGGFVEALPLDIPFKS